MRISRIAISNFLSFRDFVWEAVDEGLNLIVGPNGVGKSNLFTAIRVAADTLGRSSAGLIRQPHGASPGEPSSIALDIELDTRERETVLAFLAAAASDDSELQQTFQTNFDRNAVMEFSDTVLRHVREHPPDWLFKGRLVCEFDGRHRISARYESVGDRFFYWDINGDRNQTFFATKEAIASRQTNTMVRLWRGRLTENAPALATDYFCGARPEPPEFDLDQMLSIANQGVHILVRAPNIGPLPAFRALERLTGQQIEPNGQYTVYNLFGDILNRAIIATDNRRVPIAYRFAAAELTRPEFELSSGRDLARRLFLLKNGDRQQRERYWRIRGLFRRLTGCEFDVRTAPSRQESDEIQLELVTLSSWGDVSLELSGAGRAEALFVSTIIEADSDQVLLLDEPAANLHPTVQASIVQELFSFGRAQSFVTTHSAALMSGQAMLHVSRLYLNEATTERAALGPSTLDPATRTKLDKELRRSSDARALLFARAVILVEGETELGAIPVWFEQQFGQPADWLNVVIFCVSGDPNFELYFRYLDAFHVPWVAFCDGKVVGDQQPSRMVKQLGARGVQVTTHSDYKRLRGELETAGVYTWAPSPEDGQEAFEDIPEVRSVLEEAAQAVHGTKSRRYISKPRVGREIAERIPPPPIVQELLTKALRHLGIGTQLSGQPADGNCV